MNDIQLEECIEQCKAFDSKSQKLLYLHMYNYGMSIASRYGSTKQDVEEIANDSFCKMLTKIKLYDHKIPFKLWVRKIIINTAIDHHRKNKSKKIEMHNLQAQVPNLGEQRLDKEYLLKLLNRLSTQYKLVFLLHVIEGYSHKEIAEKLNISTGTSKSNLSKAKNKLKTFLGGLSQEENYERRTIG